MTVLKKGARIRRHLLIKAVLQLIAAAGLAICALGVRSEVLVLIVCLGISVYLGRAGQKTLQVRRKFEAQAKAEKVLLNLVPELEDRGFTFARWNRLPSDCRDYLVAYPSGGEIAFVIGLAGMWPSRGSVEGPQRVSTELSSYGTPHVPVVLAAFMDGALEQDVYGVLAVTPQRLGGALEDVVIEFDKARAQPPQPVGSIHAPIIEPASGPNRTFEGIA